MPCTTLTPLAILFALLCWATPSLALDCIEKPTATDRVLCGSADLLHADQSLWHEILSLEDFVTDEVFAGMVADQRQWLDTWARSCEAATSQGARADCLEAGQGGRSIFLSRRHGEIAGSRQSGPPFDIGGLPLVLRMTGRGCVGELFIGETVVAECVYRIDPLARFRNDSVDAMAFVANTGGAGYICANFPVYIVAVRSGQQAEVTRVPATFGNRRHDACVAARRAASGFVFTATPRAALYGWSQEWTPERGLSAPIIVPFAPRLGTTMRNDPGGHLVDNEQFSLTLRRLAEQAGEPAEAWLAGFAWAADQMMIDDLPRFRVFDGCSHVGGPGRCDNEARMRAIYDSQTEKLYFIRAEGIPECQYAWQHIESSRNLAGSTFLPSQQEWPQEALAAMKRSYCGPS